MNRRLLGSRGEQFAASFVTELGMKIIHHNWRCRFGEIDLIAYDKQTLVFIEVRTRTKKQSDKQKFGSVLEAVTLRKQQQVRKVAEMYLYQYRKLEDAVRFDVVLVEVNDDKMNTIHIPHAF